MATPRPALAYAVGLAAMLLTTAIQLLQPDRGIVIILYVPSIMLAAYVGGRMPALVITAVATATSAVLCAPPGSFFLDDATDVERLVALLFVGVTVSTTVNAMTRAREAAERSLVIARKGEERLSRIFFASPVAKSLSRLDDRRVVDVNEAYLRTFGVAYADIVGKMPVDAGVDVGNDPRERLIEHLRGGGELRDVEIAFRVHGGEERTVLMSSQVVELDGEPLAMSTFVDLTARKRAEDEARVADARLRELASMIDASFWVMDAVTRTIAYVSPGYEKVFGLTAASLVADPRSWLSVVHPDDRKRMACRRIEDAGDDVNDFRVLRVDGSVRWLTSRVYTLRDEHGAIVRFAGVCEDITPRKQAESEARASEEKFHQLASSIEEVFWMTDVGQHEVIYVSPNFEKVMGRPAASICGAPRGWAELVHPDDRGRMLQAASAGKIADGFDERVRIVRPSGEERWIRVKAFSVRDAAGTAIRIAGVAEDITDDIVLQDKLHQSQKLESIGLLAGGVAHDFNNILCVITANLEMLAEGVPPASPDRELIAEIGIAAERACSLTRQLLAFSRQQVVAPVILDLNETVDETRRMLRRMLGEDVTLRVALDPDLGRVCVDPGQISQVLMNLCVNARDAMAPGGTITIETRAERGNALIIVSDNGPGIPDDIQARVFEPFFTTKPIGKGTGLGLAVVHGIVEQAGGSIELTSRVGVGTTFGIRLPTATIGEQDGQLEAVEIVRGTERVLLVDDDLHLRAAATRALASRGYEVLEAVDGRDALRVLRNQNVDLLITDIVMPEMNGRELVEAVAREFPHIRVLYTSGYTDDEIVRRGIRQAEVEFLEKPFGVGALAAKVKAVLEAGPVR